MNYCAPKTRIVKKVFADGRMQCWPQRQVFGMWWIALKRREVCEWLSIQYEERFEPIVFVDEESAQNAVRNFLRKHRQSYQFELDRQVVRVERLIYPEDPGRGQLDQVLKRLRGGA